MASGLDEPDSENGKYAETDLGAVGADRVEALLHELLDADLDRVADRSHLFQRLVGWAISSVKAPKRSLLQGCRSEPAWSRTRV